MHSQSAYSPQDGANFYATQEVLAKSRDLNWLAALAIPHVMQFDFPPLFLYFWAKCLSLVSGERGFPKLALGIPRGHGKTIFLKLLILAIILFTRRRFILVICARAELAEAIVSDVVDMLDHPNIRTLFGAWDSHVEVNRQDAKRFSFRGRTIILKGVGQGTSFRGIAEKFSRPDVMLFDDSQTKDSAMSVSQAQAYASWFRGTAMKAKDPKFCFYLYVGNIYPKFQIEEATDRHPAIFGCMLKNLKLSKAWESIIVGAILADGNALWEDLQSKEQLLAEYEEDCEAGQEDVFLAEVMNDDEAINSGIFDETKVAEYPYSDAVIPQGAFLIIDPSLGRTKSDAQMVGECHVIDGNTCLVDLQNHQVSAPQLVRNCIDWCLDKNIPAIAIESYAYQASLGQWFEQILEDEGIQGINILFISRGRSSKNSGIRSMLRELMSDDLYVHPRARSTLYAEIRVWNPMKSDNVDNSLDVATYCNMVALTYPQEIQVNLLGYLGSNSPTTVIDCGMHY